MHKHSYGANGGSAFTACEFKDHSGQLEKLEAMSVDSELVQLSEFTCLNPASTQFRLGLSSVSLSARNSPYVGRRPNSTKVPSMLAFCRAPTSRKCF